MGANASLIRYPADVFDKAKAGKTFYPPNGRNIEHCHLHRSWDELHPALASFGLPLSLALNGDYAYEGGLQHFGWGESESDHYLGFVSPPLVRDIASRLDGLAFEQLAAKISEPGRGTEYLAARFKSLVAFYTTASVEGNCVFIHVA